jgi:hypothetical protein
MTGSDDDRDRNRRPSTKDLGWSHRSDTRWSNDQKVG